MSTFGRSNRFIKTRKSTESKDLVGHQSFIGHNGQQHDKRGKSSSQGNGQLSNDYIKVLQDQVYFLELENNLLKTNGGGSGSTHTHNVTHGHVHNPYTDSGGPLDEQLGSLRAKYETMIQQHQQDIEELRQKHIDTEKENDDMRRELEYVTQDRDLLAKQLEALQDDSEQKQSSLLEINLQFEENERRLEERVKQMSREYDSIVEQLAATKEANTEKLMNLRSETYKNIERGKKAENKVRELGDKLRHHEAEVLELREEVKRGHEKEQKALYDLRNENLQLRQDVKRSKLKLEQAQAAEQKAQDIFESLMQENNQVKEQIEHLEGDITEMRRKEFNREQDGKSWSMQIVELKRKVVLLQSEMDDFPQKLAEKDDKIKELRMFVRKTEELNIRLDTQKDREKRLSEAAEEQGRVMQQLKRDRIISQQNYEDLVQRHGELTEQYESTRKERDGMAFEFHRLKDKASIAASIEALNLGNFMQMSESNLKVAATIKDLMGKLQATEQQQYPGQFGNTMPSQYAQEYKAQPQR